MIYPGAPVFILVVIFTFVLVTFLTHSFGQATQHLSIWHSNFGSMAHFLASDSDDTQAPDVQETCSELLAGLAFLFQDLDPLKPENAYQSQFLLQLLAHMHLQPCIGCPDVLRLNTDSLKAHGVRGMLSLCCAAVSNPLAYKLERQVNY
ncbi:hypothetical protein EDD16DRAFT_1493378 [Pisolithus croceorrhizus]|nr:hypothetical protein EDD16DRAFT_1493378 [Pisolithus croceorrhizus]KAI6154441.1 hypothetical protein EDD17DRAFT_1490096 [Pisolithus thermaeus]